MLRHVFIRRNLPSRFRRLYNLEMPTVPYRTFHLLARGPLVISSSCNPVVYALVLVSLYLASCSNAFPANHNHVKTEVLISLKQPSVIENTINTCTSVSTISLESIKKWMLCLLDEKRIDHLHERKIAELLLVS